MQVRDSWSSKLGFILAAMGSAVGVANIVRFPFLVGEHGGAAFIIVYLLCLLLLGVPLIISEIAIGRATMLNPVGAFFLIGKSFAWRQAGVFIVFTGLLISSFYGVLSGWLLGYFIAALNGSLLEIKTPEQAQNFYYGIVASKNISLSLYAGFMGVCFAILYLGVRRGIEFASKLLMPIMVVLLLMLAYYGLSLPNAKHAIKFLFTPNWQQLNFNSVLLALGQAFFTLSLGQGTMLTYGSYLSKENSIFKCCIPVVIADTFISLLASVVIFTIVFASKMAADSGLALVFNTLPLVFAKMSWAYPVSIMLTGLILLAALTSQLSVLQPVIAYFIDELGWPRSNAVFLACSISVILGIPSALSYLWPIKLNVLYIVDRLCTTMFIPVGGMLVAILAGWKWGIKDMVKEINFSNKSSKLMRRYQRLYLGFSIKYFAPLAISLIMFKNYFS